MDIMYSIPCRIDNKDFPMQLRFFRNDSIYSNFSFEETLPGDTDIPRLRKGLVGGQFWSVFIPWYNP
jgi:membrane dipeptidase